MAVANKTSALRPPKAPRLPVSPIEYEQRYQDALLSVLRLYFNELDNFALATLTPNVGTTAQRPIEDKLVGQQFYDTTLEIPIWWNGTVWKNASGTTV
jgi:hypothetical protein